MEISASTQAPEVVQRPELPAVKARQDVAVQVGSGPARGAAMAQKNQVESAKRAEAAQEMVEKTSKLPKPEEVAAAMLEINRWLNNRQVEVSHDDAAGKNVYRLTEKDSGKLIIQFPAEEVLNVSRRINQMVEAQQQGALSKQAGAVAGALFQKQA